MTAAVSRRFRHTASRSPWPVVSSASTRTASRSPEISVEVLAGRVAGALSSHPGPAGTSWYPLLKTSIDSELSMLTPYPFRLPRSAARQPDGRAATGMSLPGGAECAVVPGGEVGRDLRLQRHERQDPGSVERRPGQCARRRV